MPEKHVLSGAEQNELLHYVSRAIAAVTNNHPGNYLCLRSAQAAIEACEKWHASKISGELEVLRNA